MAHSRTHDRLVGAALGALLVLVLLVVAAAVGWTLLTDAADPSGRPASQAPRPAPPAAGQGRPPADLEADQTWLGDVTLDAGRLVTVDADLRDVTATGGDVVAGPDGTRAGRLEVEATVPFDVVAEQLGPRTTVEAAADGQAAVRRSVELFGRELEIVATGTVEAERGLLVVEPRTVDLGGPDFLSDAVGAAVRELVVIEQEVDGLPEGLVLREVTVTPDGFRARLDGEDVLIAPQTEPADVTP